MRESLWCDGEDRAGRVRTEHEGHQYGRNEPGREERDHMERNRDNNGTVRRGEESMWRGRLALKSGKRSRDEAEGRIDGTESRAAKVSRTQSDVRRSTELTPDDKGAPANLTVDRRASDLVPRGPLNGAKPQQTSGFDPLGSFPWPAPSNMMGRMAMPFPPFAPPPFPHAGRGAPPVIPPNGSHMQGRANVVPPPLPGTQGANSRHKHFILLARNIPEDKMMIGPIIAFFQRFGLILDVVRAPPDRAFILFERRENASAALSSVDAVMGNRHIRLAWARDSDFAEANLSLTNDGKLVAQDKPSVSAPSTFPRRTNAEGTMNKSEFPRRANSGPQNMESTPVRRNFKNNMSSIPKPIDAVNVAQTMAPEVSAPLATTNGKPAPPQENIDAEAAAAEDLRRKKEKIVAMRKEQEARRAQLQNQYEHLVKKQKELFDQVVKVQDKEADVLKTQLRQVQEEAMKVRSELHPQVGAKRKAVSATTPITSAKRFRKPDISSFVVDNRPKNVLITGASADVTEEKARSVFRETLRVARAEEGWLIAFATRRAAESALRAIGPLKRGFGITSAIQIVSTSLPQVPKSPAGKGNDESSEKATKSVNDPHAAEAGTGRTARRSVVKSEPRSVVMGESKSAVETGLKAVGKSGPKSVVKSKPALQVKGEPTPVIGPSAINNAMTNVATKTEDTLME